MQCSINTFPYFIESNDADYMQSLQGPWLLADHYLMVQRGTMMFLQTVEAMKKYQSGS